MTPTPVLMATDYVLIHDHKVLLIKRRFPPYEDLWALPGGFLEPGETLLACAVRELFEETNTKPTFSLFVGVYDAPERDRRGRVISAAFVGHTDTPDFKAGDDAKHCEWHPIDELPQFAFDHDEIVRDALHLIGY